jgi:hypothetical protein
VKPLRPAVLVLATLVATLLAGCGTSPNSVPYCPPLQRDAGPEVNTGPVILIAQSVPSATQVPCITALPAGWTFGGERFRNGRSEFWLDSDRAGFRAVTVTLSAACDAAGAVEVPTDPDEGGTRRFESPRSLPPYFQGDRFYVFPGGCVTYRFSFSRGGSFVLAQEATQALSFISRAVGVQQLALEGFKLCGAGVTCPG